MNRYLPACCLLSSLVFPLVSSAAQFEVNDDNRQWLDLTVYNQDLGVINEVREVSLPKGRVDIGLTDIVMTIDPRTAAVKADDFVTSSQKYRFELLISISHR